MKYFGKQDRPGKALRRVTQRRAGGAGWDAHHHIVRGYFGTRNVALHIQKGRSAYGREACWVEGNDAPLLFANPHL